MFAHWRGPVSVTVRMSIMVGTAAVVAAVILRAAGKLPALPL